MHRLFDAESPLMNGLGKIFDCMLLSLCWISASLPIVTMGAACGALYRTVYRCLRKDDGGPLKMFWTTWKANLKPGILTWLPIMAVYAFLIADAIVLRGISGMSRLLGIVILLIGVASVWAAYCTAYCVRFEGTLKERLGLCIYLVLAHPLTSIMIMLFLVMGLVLALLVPFLLLFVPGGICLAISFPMESVFRKHMRPEDIEKIDSEE